MTIDSILKRNFQTISTNRFVVDSPRFWRPEYHPRFKDIFSFSDIEDIFTVVNNELPFPIDSTTIGVMSRYCFEFFSGYRFAHIPKKNPEAPAQFLSELYFTLLDILGQISFKNFPLVNDDFNLVTHKAETGKVDTSKVGTHENNRQDTGQTTNLDILTAGRLSQQNTTMTENVDEETDQNTTQVNDVFLSPQNQGVKPTNTNTKHEGVDGVTPQGNPAFTTNTANTNLGDSIKMKSNTSGQGQQAESELQQDSDAKTEHTNDNSIEMGQLQENATQKNDNYIETLDFNRGARLQDWYNLSKDRLWFEILHRLSRWILQVDIATAERNYVGCDMYE